MLINWKKQDLVLVIKGILIAGFFAWFFYRSAFAFIPMLSVGVLYVWWEKKKEDRQGDLQLLQQFCECILSVGNSLRAGYAVENAFVDCMKDMEMMYGADAGILEELLQIKGGLLNNRTLESLLYEMGRRTGIEEIQEFAEVFVITKRNGGSMTDIISLTEHTIRNRLEVREEIQVLLASKRMEQKVMNVMPFLLVLYLQISTPGYFDLFFGNLSGIVLMTGLLLWYLAAYGASEYIFWKVVG